MTVYDRIGYAHVRLMQHWIMRLPNYLKLDARPFEKDVYTGPENDDDVRANPELLRERSASIKLEVENTMRWRWIRDANGNQVRTCLKDTRGLVLIYDMFQQVRQSNARVVKWSDGSLSLQLGKELYDISPNVNLDPSVAPTTPQAGNGLNYLVAQHKRSMVLQAEAPIAGTLGIRPVGMDTDAHRKLVRAVSQKNTRLARIKIDDRAPALDQLQGNAGKKKSAGGPRRPRDPDAPRRPRKPRMSTAWSDDEEEDLIARGDSDDEPSPAKRRAGGAAKKKKRAPEDGEEGAGGYKTGGFVVSDSESDEDGSPKKKKRKADRDASPDELEQMERQIERREAERKKATGGKTATTKAAPKAAPAPQPTPQRAPPEVSSGGEEEMDIESEEEDDMPQVGRKTGRRKVAFEDDDDE